LVERVDERYLLGATGFFEARVERATVHAEAVDGSVALSVTL
jgi:hypothetical protein